MEATQTVTLEEHTAGNGRNYYVLNGGEFYADVETGVVYAADDSACSNPLGGWDGSTTFVPLPGTPSHQMAGLNLGDAEAARLEGERRRQARAEEMAAGLGEDDVDTASFSEGSPRDYTSTELNEDAVGGGGARFIDGEAREAPTRLTAEERAQKMREEQAMRQDVALQREEDREMLDTQGNRTRMATLSAAVAKNERKNIRAINVADAQMAALVPYIDAVDSVLDMAMFGADADEETIETVEEAEAAALKNKKQRQDFRDQAVKIAINRAETLDEARIARAKAREGKRIIARENAIIQARKQAAAEGREMPSAQDIEDQAVAEYQQDQDQMNDKTKKRMLKRMRAQTDVNWWEYLPKGPKDDDQDPPAVPVDYVAVEPEPMVEPESLIVHAYDTLKPGSTVMISEDSRSPAKGQVVTVTETLVKFKTMDGSYSGQTKLLHVGGLGLSDRVKGGSEDEEAFAQIDHGVAQINHAVAQIKQELRVLRLENDELKKENAELKQQNAELKKEPELQPDDDQIYQLFDLEYMKEHDIIQGELADKLGVTQASVSNWLSGNQVCKNQDVMLTRLGLGPEPENTGGAAGGGAAGGGDGAAQDEQVGDDHVDYESSSVDVCELNGFCCCCS